MEPADDPTWKRYPETILEFPGKLRIDLRAELTDEVRTTLASLIPGPFAIISAADPKGLNENPAVNRAAVSVLQREITQRGFPHLKIVGKAADGTHREEAFAILASATEAKRLAVDADQSAYFWYDNHAFWLMGARVAAAPQQLPVR